MISSGLHSISELFQIQLDSCPWKEHKADTGRIYYHNTDTKESTWTIPKELAELKGECHSTVIRVKLKFFHLNRNIYPLGLVVGCVIG